MTALAQIIMIDLVLAGDNAMVIGLAAAGLPKDQRRKAVMTGTGAATLLRIVFAGATTQLLQIVGLLLAGGILLFGSVGKCGGSCELSTTRMKPPSMLAGEASPEAPRKTLAQATWQIVVADVSMSLDNVLALAGAARDHP